MAKKPAGPQQSKMAAVRLALRTLGKDATPRDIATFLQDKHGLTVARKLASKYKRQIFKARKEKAVAPQAKRETPPADNTAEALDPVAAVEAVKNAANQVGGLDNLKRLVDSIGAMQ